MLTGRIAVVTGGARGIGAATVEALTAAGVRVAAGDLDPAGAPGELALPLDVTDRPGFTAFLDEVERRLGPIDIMVNNAGIMSLARLEDEADDATVRQLEINLLGVIHGTREAVRRMKPRGRGHIVNVASSAGKGGFPGAATYCASKHGVVGYSEAARGELRGTGVEVTCVMPAIVRTELAAGVGDARGVRSVEPRDVADAIVAALRRPRFDVFVPRSAGAVARVALLLPRPAREGLVRLLRADRLLLDAVDAPERSGYEQRALGSGRAEP